MATTKKMAEKSNTPVAETVNEEIVEDNAVVEIKEPVKPVVEKRYLLIQIIFYVVPCGLAG